MTPPLCESCNKPMEQRPPGHYLHLFRCWPCGKYVATTKGYVDSVKISGVLSDIDRKLPTASEP